MQKTFKMPVIHLSFLIVIYDFVECNKVPFIFYVSADAACSTFEDVGVFLQYMMYCSLRDLWEEGADVRYYVVQAGTLWVYLEKKYI